MVREFRRDEPLYSCIVPIESVTGNSEEELVSFGTSVDTAILQARQMLSDNYGCDRIKIDRLIQQARIESLSPWCSPGETGS